MSDPHEEDWSIDRLPACCTRCDGTGMQEAIIKGKPHAWNCEACGGKGTPFNPSVAVENAIHGLLTDGAHHKQWYLEVILQALGVDLSHLRADLRGTDPEEVQYDWEGGIPG